MAPMIAIVGSADPRREAELGLQHLEAARSACEALGRALAEDGCDIAVYSSAASFVEGDIVRGYVSSGKAAPNSIRVWIPEGGDEAFPERRDHDASFRVTVDTTRGWEVSFYRSLFNVDGLLLVGGGQSTLVAGLIALSNRTPVVAVATFGGRATEVWRALDRVRNDATQGHIEVMGRGWRPDMGNELVGAVREQRKRRAKREAEAARTREVRARKRTISLILAAIAILVALAAIVVVYETTPKSTASLVALLVAPLFAGAAGATIRTVLDHGEEWLTTALLGIGAGLIAFAAFRRLAARDVARCSRRRGRHDFDRLRGGRGLRRRRDLRPRLREDPQTGCRRRDAPRAHLSTSQRSAVRFAKSRVDGPLSAAPNVRARSCRCNAKGPVSPEIAA